MIRRADANASSIAALFDWRERAQRVVDVVVLLRHGAERGHEVVAHLLLADPALGRAPRVRCSSPRTSCGGLRIAAASTVGFGGAARRRPSTASSRGGVRGRERLRVARGDRVAQRLLDAGERVLEVAAASRPPGSARARPAPRRASLRNAMNSAAASTIAKPAAASRGSAEILRLRLSFCSFSSTTTSLGQRRAPFTSPSVPAPVGDPRAPASAARGTSSTSATSPLPRITEPATPGTRRRNRPSGRITAGPLPSTASTAKPAS